MGGTAIVSPHQDDAALSLGASVNGLPKPVEIITIFGQSNYTVSAGHKLPESTVTPIRRAEDLAYATRIAAKVNDLGIPSTALRTGVSGNQVFAARNGWRGILRDDLSAVGDVVARRLEHAIDQCAPDLLFLPAAIGLHRDHLMARTVARDLANSRGILWACYEDLPYAAGWSDLDIRSWIALFDPGLNASVIEADASSLAEKRDGLRLYPSQLTERDIQAVIDYSRRWSPPAERIWRI